MLLPGLHIPHVVGAGMCRMLTGGMPARNTRHYDRRPNREHPNFAECTVNAEDVLRAQQQQQPQQLTGTTATTRKTQEALRPTLLATDRGPASISARDVGGFGTCNAMTGAAMSDAADNCRLNAPGGVHNSFLPSEDPFVLRQLHYAATNRHRQHIPAVPDEVLRRADAARELLRTARDALSASERSGAAVAHGAGLPASTLARSAGASGRDAAAVMPAEDGGNVVRAVAPSKRARAEAAKKARRGGTSKLRDAQVDPEPEAYALLRVPVPHAAFRRKDEIKTHHEAKHSAGAVLLRG
jgi:hypothetical protein